MTLREVGDLDLWSTCWHGQPLRRLVARAGLKDVTPEALGPLASWEAFPTLLSGHVVAASGVQPTAGADAVVASGPCLGDGTRGLTLEAVVDTVQALLVGQALGVPVVLFLGDAEEALSAGGSGKWTALAQRFAAFIPHVANALGGVEVHAVPTSSADHDAALRLVEDAAAALPGGLLDAAFHLGSFPVREQPEEARVVSRRVVAAHAPAVVAAHLGRDEAAARPHVVIAANLQQAGTWSAVSHLAPSGGVSFVGHFPVPSLSGYARAYRAEPWDKPMAADLLRLVAGEVDAACAGTRRYFSTWLGAERRAALADAAARY